MEKDYLVSVIERLEGYKTRLKELHWSSPSHSIHIITDDFSEELGKFEDDLAENGITARSLKWNKVRMFRSDVVRTYKYSR